MLRISWVATLVTMSGLVSVVAGLEVEVLEVLVNIPELFFFPKKEPSAPTPRWWLGFSFSPRMRMNVCVCVWAWVWVCAHTLCHSLPSYPSPVAGPPVCSETMPPLRSPHPHFRPPCEQHGVCVLCFPLDDYLLTFFHMHPVHMPWLRLITLCSLCVSGHGWPNRSFSASSQMRRMGPLLGWGCGIQWLHTCMV